MSRLERTGLLLLLLVASLGALVVLAQFAAPSEAASGYDRYLSGSGADVSPAASGGLALMGGGTDVDGAFRWMVAASGGGDFVVLRTSGSDGYNDYVMGLGGGDSVETFVVHNRAAASDPYLLGRVRDAEAVFVAGGDQWEYVSRWKDTPLEDAVHGAVGNGAVVGGTSAGLAILGEFVFSAENGTVLSDEALADPFDRYVTLESDFLALPHMGSTVTDTHFSERGRMGRLLAFVGRLARGGEDARGIGVDEATAILVGPDGDATVRGRGSAFFLKAPGAPELCEPQEPLLFRRVPVYRAGRGDTFDLSSWKGRGGTGYVLSARDGELARGGRR